MTHAATTAKLIALVVVAFLALGIALSLHKYGASDPAGAINRMAHAFVTFNRTVDDTSSANKTVAANTNEQSGLSQSGTFLEPTTTPRTTQSSTQSNPRPTARPTSKPVAKPTAKPTAAASKTTTSKTTAKPTATPTPRAVASKTNSTYEQVPYVTDYQNSHYVAQGPNTGAGQSITYVVQCGDTLTGIALGFYGDMSKAQAIYDANSRLIPDVNQLSCGITLRIP